MMGILGWIVLGMLMGMAFCLVVLVVWANREASSHDQRPPTTNTDLLALTRDTCKSPTKRRDLHS